MKINQRDTAIDNYHSNIKYHMYSQNSKMLDLMEKYNDYSLSELKRLYSLTFCDIDKSTVSRIINSLHKDGYLEYADKRKCTITGITISPSKKVINEHLQNF